MKNGEKCKAALMMIILMLSVTISGCESKTENFEITAETSTTVTIDGTPIILGLSLLEELEDAGYMVTSDSKLENLIPENEIMPPRTYDVGIYFGKDGILYGTVQCLNDKMEEEIPYIQSIINKITVYYSESTDPYSLPLYYESVLVNGEDWKDMTADEFLAALGDSTDEKPSITKYPDESTAYISFSNNHCYISANFDMVTHKIIKAEIEMFHSNF